MEYIENTEPKFYKRKMFVIPAVMLVFAALVSAAVLYASSVGTITVNEALNQTTASFAISGFPSETIEYNFTITNDAANSISTQLTFSEGVNANAVNYTSDMPKTIVMTPGSNTVPVHFTIDSGSPVGIFNGTVQFTRL